MHEKYYVFVDVDETLVKIKTMRSFLKFYLVDHKREKIKFLIFSLHLKFLNTIKVSREKQNIVFYKIFKNYLVKDIEFLVKEWFYIQINKSNFLNEKVIEEIIYHKKNGGIIVLVSGSFVQCLLPLANYLDINFILASQLEVKENKFTGFLVNEPIIGCGKVKAIQKSILDINQEVLKLSYAYSDHESDLPMLNFVGNPVVVGDNAFLIRKAIKENWKII